MAWNLPALAPPRQRLDVIGDFGGYNHSPRIREHEFSDMRNMASGLLPVMTVRARRGFVRSLREPGGLFAHDEKLCWVDGTGFYYDGVRRGTVTRGEKTFVRMGACVLIWPDAVCFDSRTGEFGPLGASVTTTGTVRWALCRADGTDYGDYAVSDVAPAQPEAGQLWLDTSVSPCALRVYSPNTGMWTALSTVYTRLSAEGIGAGLKQYDGVTIRGVACEALNGEFCLMEREDDAIVVTALIAAPGSQTDPVTVERRVPEMDYVCELDNRVWGCSNEKHEIYACALGDPRNWNQFLGQGSDSFAATVGSAGRFTGCCAQLGRVVFFKEDVIHTVMGYAPANFRLDTLECRGVMEGCHRSLCRVNETLLYKSRSDVCRLGTLLPESISQALGPGQWRAACAGALDGRYYLCMRDERGTPALFVYDSVIGVWVREDESDVLCFAALEGELYMLLRDGGIWTVNGTHARRMEPPVRWMLETGDIALRQGTSLRVSGLRLLARCELGTTAELWAQCDGGPWEAVCRVEAHKLGSVTIPYVPPRCSVLRLRLTGEGPFRLYTLSRRVEEAGT